MSCSTSLGAFGCLHSEHTETTLMYYVKASMAFLSGTPSTINYAKTMAVFMVHGLFSKLRFPYAQFPSADLTGDLLYDVLWHMKKSEFSFKVQNPFSTDKRFLYFFSDPPHVIKTTRNCWESNKRCLWVLKHRPIFK